jgi:ABC-2 type transport system ATP-binding protein
MGLNPLEDRAELRQRIGYMPQGPALYDDLSARGNVAFFGAAHGTMNLKKRVDGVIRFTNLSERAGNAVHTFSGGMKRRVSLACALVHEPEVIFLDEPTAAVDPQLRSRFWKTFRELADGGTTLFISTHLMDEAILCDRIAILRAGSIIATDTPGNIVAQGKTRLVVEREGTQDEETIGGHPGDLAAALRPYGLEEEVTAVEVRTDTLEEVVLALIEREEVG